MNDPTHAAARMLDLGAKIARLVEERGWNQEDFARIAQLNRHTVREIIKNSTGRRLRNATIAACAKAFGLSAHDLRTLPVERLVQRLRQSSSSANGDDQWHQRGAAEYGMIELARASIGWRWRYHSPAR